MKKKVFYAGYNIPNHLSKPSVHETFDEAKRSLIWSMKNIFEGFASDEDAAEKFSATAEDINLWSSEQYVTCNGTVFFITSNELAEEEARQLLEED